MRGGGRSPFSEKIFLKKFGLKYKLIYVCNKFTRMFKRFIPVFVLVSLTAKAQVTISGKIVDGKSKPLPGVSIGIKNSYDGGTSDSTGNYLFNTDEKGEQILEASATGYKPFQLKINLTGTPLKINISLKERITELKAVVITAGTFEASDQKKTTVLSPLDIVT